jgi:hypothetical protein
MTWLAGGLVATVMAILAYRALAPRVRRKRPFDAGSVSTDWLAHHKQPPER